MRFPYFTATLLLTLTCTAAIADTSSTSNSTTFNNNASASNEEFSSNSTSMTSQEQNHLTSSLNSSIPSVSQQAAASQQLETATSSANPLSASTTVPASPSIDPATTLTTEMHNLMQAWQDPTPLALLDNTVLISGLMNIDLSGWTHPYFTGSRNAYLDLNTANISVDVQPTAWLTARASVLYANGSSPNVENYHEAFNTDHTVQLNEAYVALGNFANTPFFIAAGQQYLPFGDYYRYPITESLTQVLSETTAPAVQIGFAERGLSASIYGLNGADSENNGTNSGFTNFGLDTSYTNMDHAVGYKVSAGYLNNMADIDSIYGYLRAENASDYQHRVGGVSLDGDLYTGPFSFGADFVSALSRFNSNNYAYTTNDTNIHGAKPYAAGLNAGYQFQAFSRKSQLNIGYQWSHQAYNTAPGTTSQDPTRLPQQRWIADYDIYVLKYMVLGLEVYRQQDYSTSHGGNGNYDNTAIARINLFI